MTGVPEKGTTDIEFLSWDWICGKCKKEHQPGEALIVCEPFLNRATDEMALRVVRFECITPCQEKAK